jgi:hypothetical protein
MSSEDFDDLGSDDDRSFESSSASDEEAGAEHRKCQPAAKRQKVGSPEVGIDNPWAHGPTDRIDTTQEADATLLQLEVRFSRRLAPPRRWGRCDNRRPGPVHICR